jgi:hypothetical protein
LDLVSALKMFNSIQDPRVMDTSQSRMCPAVTLLLGVLEFSNKGIMNLLKNQVRTRGEGCQAKRTNDPVPSA